MSPVDVASTVFLAVSLFFFTAGTIGLVRLPDVHSRLHALTKADNVGLGCVVLAGLLQASDWTEGFKLVLIWFLVLAAATNVGFLIAGGAGKRDHDDGEGDG
jgi:multicomponent Na+:H+ antiporter subunit G